MSTPEQAVQQYAFSHYGHLILIDNPIFDETEGYYISNLRSDYPFVIKDDKAIKKKSLHVLKIDHLGYITMGKDCKIIHDRTTPRLECVRNIDLFFDAWQRRAEQIVVTTSADNFARITRFDHFFEPIDAILHSLWKYHKVYDAEIKTEPIPERRNKLCLYLELLEGLEIIRRVDRGYNEGKLALFLRDKYQNSREKFRTAVISTLIRERYTTLRDVFKLTIFERTIHIDNCIYLPEMEAEKSVYRTIESIQDDYRKYYRHKISQLNTELILYQLEGVDAIKSDGKHFYGNEKLLKEMMCVRKKIPLTGKGFFAKS